MLKGIKRLLKSVLARVVNRLVRILAPGLPSLGAREWENCGFSFSQFGEDRLLEAFQHDVENPSHRVYVDIGAHDPARFSNTLLLYKAGWRGVNVDANPESILQFRNDRPNDFNICEAVSDDVREVEYCQYELNATNRVSDLNERHRTSIIGQEPLNIIRTRTRPLNSLLNEIVDHWDRIGFLNIDCEGEDLRILHHFDFARWRPYLIAVEAHDEATCNEMTQLMWNRGYRLVGKTFVTLFFRVIESHT